jgi:hypothetical protein
METNILLSFIYKYFKMKIPSSERKRKIEKIRKKESYYLIKLII